MSKTVDDLVKVYIEAFDAMQDLEDWPNDSFPDGTCERAGIAAVVSELMEHFVTGASTYAWDADDLHAEFMKILGDAGEKVAEYTGGMNDLCVTDPTPAVCEWRANEYEGAYSPGCETPAVWYSDGSETPQKEGYNFCPSCGLPIKFTEAKT